MTESLQELERRVRRDPSDERAMQALANERRRRGLDMLPDLRRGDPWAWLSDGGMRLSFWIMSRQADLSPGFSLAGVDLLVSGWRFGTTVRFVRAAHPWIDPVDPLARQAELERERPRPEELVASCATRGVSAFNAVMRDLEILDAILEAEARAVRLR